MEGILTPRDPPVLAAAIAAGLAEGHRFRDDIVGDLEDEYRRRLGAEGAGAALRWYWREAVRVPLPFGRALRLMALAGGGYVAVLGAASTAGRILPSSAWALMVIGASAAVAGRLMARMAGRASAPAIAVFWALALAIGGPYIARAPRPELWLHVGKVSAVMLASGLGLLRWRRFQRGPAGPPSAARP